MFYQLKSINKLMVLTHLIIKLVIIVIDIVVRQRHEREWGDRSDRVMLMYFRASITTEAVVRIVHSLVRICILIEY